MKHFILTLSLLMGIAPMQAQKNKKILVAYFSCTGTTAAVAGQVAKATGGDLYEIQPAKAYTAADLDWTDKQSRSTIEMQNKASRPAIKGKVANMKQYNTIYLGFPIWWYIAPTIINTFLEAHDLQGKTIVPFFTSGGSGAGKTLQYLRPSAPKANWKNPENLTGATQQTINKWVKK